MFPFDGVIMSWFKHNILSIHESFAEHIWARKLDIMINE